MTDNMTDQHPITPPPELQEEWLGPWPQDALLQAARWGADMELDACCKWMANHFHGMRDWTAELRAARRPKPRSLAEEATLELDEAAMRGDCVTTTEAMSVLRRALKRLQELEGQGDDCPHERPAPSPATTKQNHADQKH